VNAGVHDHYTRIDFKHKRFNRKAFIRRQKIASDASQHYRSVLTTLASPLVPGGAFSASVNAYPFTADSFWTTPGGLQVLDSTSVGGPTFGGTDLFLRGGQSRIGITNVGITPNTTPVSAIRVTIWRAISKAANPPIPANLTVDELWDPSILADFQNNYIFTKPTQFIIQPNETIERTEYIKGRKIDQTLYNTDSMRRELWFVKVAQAVSTPLAVNTQITVGHNLAFSGDNIGTT